MDIEYKDSTEYSEQSLKKYHCGECQYISNRVYNLERHIERIHSQKINKSCCGKKFSTKGDWYLHCEERHPKFRPTALISRKKYKIFRKTENLMQRPTKATRKSNRIQKLIEKQEAVRLKQLDVEENNNDIERKNVLLINLIENPQLCGEFHTKSLNEYCNDDNDDDGGDDDDDDATDGTSLTITMSAEADGSINYNDNDSNASSCRSIDINYYNNQSIMNFKIPFLTKSTDTIKNINLPTYLPIKKRILQKLQYNIKDKNCLQQSNEKPIGNTKMLKCNKENFNGDFENQFDLDIKSNNVNVIIRKEPITWDQITEYHREYLSSVNFDGF